MPPCGVTASNPADRAATYRQAARRLRGRHRHQPQRLHQQLRELSERHDAARTPQGMVQQEWSRPTVRTGGGAARLSAAAMPHSGGHDRPRETFAADVARRLEGPVLRQSQRRTLLATARQLGIARFEANLLIAMVQHQRAHRKTPATVPTGQRSIPRHAGAVVLFLIVQTFIIWGACRVWIG